MRYSPILQRHEEADDRSHRQYDTRWIHLQEFFLPIYLDGLHRVGKVKEDQNNPHNERPNRHIDVETPAPGDSTRERTTKQRPSDCS